MLVEFQCVLANFWCMLVNFCVYFGQFPMNFLVHFRWICWSISYGHYELVGMDEYVPMLVKFQCVCQLIFGVYVGYLLGAFWSISDKFVGVFFGGYVGQFPTYIMSQSVFDGYVPIMLVKFQCVCVCYLIFGVYVGFFVCILVNFRWILLGQFLIYLIHDFRCMQVNFRWSIYDEYSWSIFSRWIN